MTCPGCGGDNTSTVRTANGGDRVSRKRACEDCGGLWWSDEGVRKGSFVVAPVRTNGTGAIGAARDAPLHGTTPSARTDAAGGVGGGLSADWSDLVPGLTGPSRQSGSDARVPFKSRPTVHVGAATPAFMRVYRRYPNPHQMQQAAQVFQDLALCCPGGEDALADEIEASFDAGFLLRHPYSSDQAHRPKLAVMLAGMCWREPEPAPDPVATAKPAETHAQRDERAKREGLERRVAAKAALEAKERAAEAAIAARAQGGGP